MKSLCLSIICLYVINALNMCNAGNLLLQFSENIKEKHDSTSTFSSSNSTRSDTSSRRGYRESSALTPPLWQINTGSAQLSHYPSTAVSLSDSSPLTLPNYSSAGIGNFGVVNNTTGNLSSHTIMAEAARPPAIKNPIRSTASGPSSTNTSPGNSNIPTPQLPTLILPHQELPNTYSNSTGLIFLQKDSELTIVQATGSSPDIHHEIGLSLEDDS